ncbi:MAG: F0F1 ATP synthase subunit delta [Deltaproteobacteria bacterium]|nr:F0F1 ATP synthase subunit delta [Deltaproteobacteria bacterium]
MNGGFAAHRYAGAFFSLGRKQGLPKLEKFGADLEELALVLKNSPQLTELCRSPLFSATEKSLVMRKILSGLEADKYTFNFIELLAERGRLENLSEIARFFKELLDTEKGVLHGELITAVEIAGDERAAVLERLEKQAGRSLDLICSVDPDILGGIILRVGDRVLDASLRAQLSFLKDNIKRGM